MMSSKNQTAVKVQVEALEAEAAVEEREEALAKERSTWELELAQAKEKEKIALADYQNLLRRTQEERIKLVQMAGQDFATAILPALQNLSLAARALNDAGLNMVVNQLWAALNEQGLEELGTELVGQEFEVELMEAVDKSGDGKQVKQVVSPGYKMNGRVIAHAKVVVG